MNQSKTGRNQLCPCGSGQKFKKCCLSSRRETVTQPNGQVIKPNVPDRPYSVAIWFDNEKQCIQHVDSGADIKSPEFTVAVLEMAKTEVDLQLRIAKAAHVNAMQMASAIERQRSANLHEQVRRGLQGG